MSNISRVALFGKLNPIAYRGIEAATVFCKMRGHHEVELVHWLHQLLQQSDTDLHRIVRHFELDASRLASDLVGALERLPGGATRVSDIAADVEEATERAWVHASLMFGATQVRTGHLLVAMLRTRRLRAQLLALSSQFDRVRLDPLVERFDEIAGDSPEQRLGASDGMMAAAPGEASGAMAPAALGRGQALRQFTQDLTAQAREGRIDPVVGRDEEVRQLVDILMRRRQNNPMLVGEAGVGKTAVVEGFALKIAQCDVPPSLRGIELRTLDVGLLQAGASMKGEFEARLRQVIDEVQASATPIILFIDEAHTLVGAGGAAGTGDAANLLKPVLARGDLRTIGATTWAEYKKHIEKDPALTRRFQTVQVDEPDEARAVLMMRGVVGAMERHHGVQVLDEALEAAVKLAHRYIPARQLPDKSVSLLDTACARVAVSQHAVPRDVDDTRKRIQALETELAIIDRERRVGVEVAEREHRATDALADARQRLAQLDDAWQAERALVERILALRAQLHGDAAITGTSGPVATPDSDDERGVGTVSAQAADTAGDDVALAQLKALQSELAALQGERPLILPSVDYQAVASVVADWTGIPVGRMARNEIQTVLELPALLGQRVIGQAHAMEAIARRIQTSRAGLDNPDKPVGVFLLAGTSGVGKTETALALAEVLYGGEQNLITINMSEFQEPHTVSTLKGAPPGYVGYGEGGVLTEAVRRRPYSVVLLDEVEKAHPDVHEIFFQVFDKGWMEDGEGRRIDFRNTLIILTTNAGTGLISELCADPALMPDPDGLATALREPLLNVFPPALLGRLVVIPYYPLTLDMLARITRLQLLGISNRLQARYQVPLSYGEDVLRLIVERSAESESGGRKIHAIMTNTMLPDLSRKLMEASLENCKVAAARFVLEGGTLQCRLEIESGHAMQSRDQTPSINTNKLEGSVL